MSAAALLAVVLTAAPTEEQIAEVSEPVHEVPLAPRGPGVAAFWTGAGILGASAELAALGVCLACSINIDPRFQTLLVASVGTVMMLGGMAWMAWRQPSDEPVPPATGYVAMTTGLVQVAAGIMGFFSPLASSTTRHDGETTGLVIGSGVVALAAGIAWVAWAHHH